MTNQLIFFFLSRIIVHRGNCAPYRTLLSRHDIQCKLRPPWPDPLDPWRASAPPFQSCKAPRWPTDVPSECFTRTAMTDWGGGLTKRVFVLHLYRFSANTVLAISEETDETKRGGKGTYHVCVEHQTALARPSVLGFGDELGLVLACMRMVLICLMVLLRFYRSPTWCRWDGWVGMGFLRRPISP